MTSSPRFDATHERSLGFALSELVRLMRRDFLARNPVHSLTPELWRLLYCLDRDEGCRQTDLAAVLDVTPVTLGRMLDQLVKRGLVMRAPDPADRRATRVFLTRKAAVPIARMHELVDATRQRAMRGLDAAERDQFWRFLALIRENLSAPATPPRRARSPRGGR
jgi:MarR family transcriptional regulator, transcriptional regulator for hemolysin